MRFNHLPSDADDLGRRMLEGSHEMKVTALRPSSRGDGTLLLDFELCGSLAFATRDPLKAFELVRDLLQYFHDRAVAEQEANGEEDDTDDCTFN